jgi:hypothetical protein
MLLIIASVFDVAAAALAKRWQAEPAALLTPADLSRAGWSYRLGCIDQGFAIASGARIETRRLQGVLTRLAWIDARELEQIAAAEREYVGAEMTAFLLSWIAALSCPVLNRPSTTSLCGPGWSAAEWQMAACRVGLLSLPGRIGNGWATQDNPDAIQTTKLTVIGNEVLGGAPSSVVDRVLRLARLAAVELVAVHLNTCENEPKLQRVDLWPDVSDPAVADAVLSLLHRKRTHGSTLG